MDTRWTVWPAAIRPAKGLIVLLVATAAILAGPPASGQTPTPSAGTLAGSLADSLFEQVAAQAENMANAPFQTADVELTGALADIDYDAYRTIRFRKDQALWRDETPFSVELFHLGFLFRTQVQINLVDESGTHALPFDQTLFDYGQSGIGEALGSANSDAAAAIGYAGFKILYPLHRPDVRDEVAVFLGASYFRLLARNQVYGLSARGLALGTASPEGEEFPTFREFWLVKPAADSGTITVYALLDSPSLTGAYRFDIRPGAQTVVDTRLRLFARADEPLRPGLAPLTSMFLYGENRRPYHDDYRPEVHDSDGVLMHTARGEWLWRPVANPARLRVTTLLDDAAGGPAGFGLMQRDRD
ncbi:MAG: glucan biosynthesis protein, partial [Alphaproteobacteria bacterium]